MGKLKFEPATAMTVSSVFVNMNQGFSARAGRSDAFWFGTTPTLPGIPVLYVGINL